MWKLLRHYGVPKKIISLIRCTFQDMSCKIAHTGQLSESFEAKTGVRQRCLLSPFLFLLVIDWIMKTTTTGRNNGIQWTLWMQLDDLDFADDLVLLSHNHSQMQDKTTLLETTSAGTGLKMNRKKTELMKLNTTANAPITVGGEPIREVESFVYLGSVVDQEPVAKQILWRKWGWIGHTLRKPASSTTRQALTWNPQGKRKRGRPRNSWRRDTEAELRQQGTNWSGMTRAAENRVRWRGVADGLCSTGSDGHK